MGPRYLIQPNMLFQVGLDQGGDGSLRGLRRGGIEGDLDHVRLGQGLDAEPLHDLVNDPGAGSSKRGLDADRGSEDVGQGGTALSLLVGGRAKQNIGPERIDNFSNHRLAGEDHRDGIDLELAVIGRIGGGGRLAQGSHGIQRGILPAQMHQEKCLRPVFFGKHGGNYRRSDHQEQEDRDGLTLVTK